MRFDLRGHPNYQKACQVLEELPLWSLDREIAIEVIDCLSSILGLPFRYCPRIESGGGFYTVEQVMKQKIEIAEDLYSVGSVTIEYISL